MHRRLVSARRLSIAAAATALLSLAGVATATTAQAAAPQILTYANKCLDVPGAQTTQGLRLQQWACNGTVAQQFSIVPAGNGQVTIHIPFDNKCVDVQSGSLQNGAWIREWTCNGTIAQEFSV